MLGATGEVFEWDYIQKAQFIYAWIAEIAVIICLLLLCVENIDWFNKRDINEHIIGDLILLAAGLALFCSVLYAIGFRVRRNNPDSRLYPHVSIQFFVLTNVILLYYLGIFSLPAGIALAGGTITGLILFRREVVFAGLATGLGAAVGLIYLTMTGVVDYAPILKAEASAPHTNLTWLTILGGASLPYLILILSTSTSSIQRWQRREEDVIFLSITDVLTQVANRRYLMDQIDIAVSRAQRENLPVSVLMIDLDHFKKINDEHGHLTGDVVLKSAAKILTDATRKSDLVGRYGGEEFCILLPGTDQAGAHHIAERCRQELAATNIASDLGDTIKISASIGLASLAAGESSSVDQLLKAADDALYLAKERGRNRVVVSESAVPA